jgi:4-hydroxy-2-oxoglutarate aldolase
MKLQGIFVALTTPFDDDGNLYPEKVLSNLRKLNEVDLAGYVSCGSTGETPLMNLEERLQLLYLVAEGAAPGKLLIAGLASESVRESVRVANAAADAGYHAVLALTPYYYRSQMHRSDTQLVYFRTIADQSKLPVLIYNMPAVTGYDMPVETIAALSQHPNIIGMKDSSGNLDKLKETHQAVAPGFQILSGAGLNFGGALEAGATGAILAVANAIPYACQTVWEAFRMRQDEAARDWQSRIAVPAKLLPAKYGVSGLKYAMELNGYYGGPPRLPLMPPSVEARAEIEQALDGLRS